jgi:thymidylate synthase
MKFKERLKFLFTGNLPEIDVETQYLNILRDLVEKGEVKQNRTGIDTLVLPPRTLTHDMSNGFPLITTKQVGIKTVATELEFFIKGLVDKQWLLDRNCHIWDQWCNPRLVPDGMNEIERKEYQLKEKRLGPVYGSQWRNFNNGIRYSEVDDRIDYDHPSKDQFKSIIEKLKNNPDDRRMVCSAWNPLQLDEMALPPCHLMFVIQHINGKLHLNWSQRSCDFFLGIPFNLASYALLLQLICEETNMIPGTVTGNLIDVHLYKNHIEAAKEQLSRKPYDLPEIRTRNSNSIFDWEAKNTVVLGYKSHSRIKAEVAV